MKTRTLHRSAVDGRFVTERYANQHPRTTETERRPSKNPGKKSGR